MQVGQAKMTILDQYLASVHVYDKKPQRYAEDIRTEFNCMLGESEVEVVIKGCAESIVLKVEANL